MSEWSVSIEIWVNKASADYLFAVLQALEEARQTAAFFSTTDKCVEYSTRLIPENEFRFASAAARNWAKRHPDLLPHVYPAILHDFKWLMEENASPERWKEVFDPLRIFCVENCIVQYLMEQPNGSLETKVARAIAIVRVASQFPTN